MTNNDVNCYLWLDIMTFFASLFSPHNSVGPALFYTTLFLLHEVRATLLSVFSSMKISLNYQKNWNKTAKSKFVLKLFYFDNWEIHV